MSITKCERCGGYHPPMDACHEKELTQLQSVVMELGQEVHKLKSTLRDEPCDECGVNTLALLKERDELMRAAHLWEIRFSNIAVMVERYVDNPNESSLAALKTWRANQLTAEASNDQAQRPPQ